MNYFAAPGVKSGHKQRTVGQPLPADARARDLIKDDVFLISGLRYKVVRKSDKIYYKLFWHLRMTGDILSMGAKSMERIEIVDNIPYQNPGVKGRSGVKIMRNMFVGRPKSKLPVVSLINQ